MSRLFESGVPTRMDVDKIVAAVKPVVGTSVTYEDVAAIIGAAARSNRFRTVTVAWRNRLFREAGVQTAAEGGSFHFMTGDECLSHGVKGLVRVGRSAGRLYKRVGSISQESLSSDERRTAHRLLTREAAAVVEAVRTAAKQVSGPAPVTSAARLAPKPPGDV